MKRGKMTNNELKELIEVRLGGIEQKFDFVRAEIKNGSDMIEYKFNELKDINCTEHKEIIAHQKITNSRVTHLEEKNGHIEKKIGVIEWVNKNKKLTVGILIVLWFVLHSLSDILTNADIFNLIPKFVP